MGQVRAVIYGVGAMGQLVARLLLERGGGITGAVGRMNNVGRDLGELLGLHPLGVAISADAEKVLGEAQADVALLSVGETMEQAAPHLRRCVEAGLNVISLSEQVFYPWRCAPALAREIDSLAKKHGVTVSAGGIQDVFWVNPVVALSGASQTIEAIEGLGVGNADDYGPGVAKEVFLGQPVSAFQEMTPDELSRPNVFTITLEAIAGHLGLSVTGWEQGSRPLTSGSPVESRVLGGVIAPGDVIGLGTWSRMATEEGITLSGEMQLKVFEEGDVETSRWTIQGVPTLHVETPHLPGLIATCTAIINRIPDIIACEPGLVTVERLPKPRYRPRLW